MPPPTPLDVFLCSTCYDLMDLRAELASFLRDQGFYVRLSEDPTSEFSVEPTADSIETCLTNVEAADAIVCIVDRRYGGVLKDGPYKGKSATHAEVEHARSLSPTKPIFFFIRDKAASEYAFMKANAPEAKTRWVEPTNAQQRKRWFEFVGSISRLPKHENWSNWYDPFSDVVALKQLVLKRLLECFPQKSAALAMSPNRLVRMTFMCGLGSAKETIYGHFQNVGIGPALNLVHGNGTRSLDNSPEEKYHCGGLAEGDFISKHDGGDFMYSRHDPFPITVLFCEYENRFGDRYRVEQEFQKNMAEDQLVVTSVARLRR